MASAAVSMADVENDSKMDDARKTFQEGSKGQPSSSQAVAQWKNLC